MADTGISIAELWCYPVKSCAGTPLTEATVVDTGLVNDRRWMVVDGNGVFITQREKPQLALVMPSVDGDELGLSAPGMPNATLATDVDNGRRTVTIFGSLTEATDQGDEIAGWFSTFLQRKVRLVKVSDDAPRQIKDHYSVVGASISVGFADGFSILLASAASLREFNTHSKSAVPMNRFRPNIVVDGARLEPWAEDCWRTIKLGDLRTHVVRPCSRCAIPDVDQCTAERGRSVRKTLAATRSGIDLEHPEQKRGTFFGQNLVHEAVTTTTIKVGDPVQLATVAPSPNMELSVTAG